MTLGLKRVTFFTRQAIVIPGIRHFLDNMNYRTYGVFNSKHHQEQFPEAIIAYCRY